MSEFFDLIFLDRSWETLADIAPALLVRYREMFSRRGITRNFSRLTAEEDGRLMERRRSSTELIQHVEDEVDSFAALMPIPHLFLLADPEGVALFLRYPEHMQSSIREIGLQEGVSFSLQQLGINGISLAMERQTIVLVRGAEHDMGLFSDWNSLCIPIRAHGQVAGYLNLSFHHSYDVEFAVPLLSQLVTRIENRLSAESPQKKKELVFEAFNVFGLSDREKEAAYGWLLNHSVVRISMDMVITEGTVRNMIKKVYRKTNINDKGQFIRTFGRLV